MTYPVTRLPTHGSVTADARVTGRLAMADNAAVTVSLIDSAKGKMLVVSDARTADRRSAVGSKVAENLCSVADWAPHGQQLSRLFPLTSIGPFHPATFQFRCAVGALRFSKKVRPERWIRLDECGAVSGAIHDTSPVEPNSVVELSIQAGRSEWCSDCSAEQANGYRPAVGDPTPASELSAFGASGCSHCAMKSMSRPASCRLQCAPMYISGRIRTARPSLDSIPYRWASSASLDLS